MMTTADISERPTLEGIRTAARVIDGSVVRTPLVEARRLSAHTGAEILVKHENFQATNSFKDRGALAKLMSLTESECQRGVIAMSAGNHAQAVAYHARELGIPATIVMPETTPFTKVSSTLALDAQVVQEGETLAEAEQAARKIADAQGLVFVHPYDDLQVMNGQGTIGLEILEDAPDLDAVIVPIGGGGLISGIGTAVKAINPAIELIGVEAALYPSMTARLAGTEAVCSGQSLADGIAVKNVCDRAVEIVDEHASHVVVASEAEIEEAISLYFMLHKTVAEGAAAASLVPLLQEPERYRGRKVCLINCGGNIDPRILASIIMRQLEREDRIVSLRLEIDDRPGVLGRVAGVIGEAGGNILEVHHGRLVLEVPARSATLDLLVEARDRTHSAAIVAALQAEGWTVHRLSAPSGAVLATTLD